MKILRHAALISLVAAFSAHAGTTAVLCAPVDEQFLPVLASVEEVLRAAGMDVSRVDPAALSGGDVSTILLPESLLVLTDASSLPQGSIPGISRFLETGGDMLALNAPAWSSPSVNMDGKWVPVSEFRGEFGKSVEKRVFLDFSKEDLALLPRGHRTPEYKGVYELTADGPEQGVSALHARIDKLDGWDTIGKRFDVSPYADGHTLTVFQARSLGGANSLALEWEERDGSRWIATVSLSKEWRRYVLTPADFIFWESVPDRQDTQFNPANAVRLAVTQAFTHTGFADKNLEYALGPLSTAKLDEKYASSFQSHPVPVLEAFSPGYKFYAMSDVASLRLERDGSPLSLPANMKGMHPRPGPGGFDKKRGWSWEPLVSALGGNGEYRGAVAALFTDLSRPGIGRRAVFSVSDPGWYVSEAGRSALKDAVRALHASVAVVDAGANYYTYFEDQPVVLGLTLANCAPEAVSGITAKTEVADGADVVVSVSWETATIGAGASVRYYREWRPARWPETGYTVTTTVSDASGASNRSSHQIFVWKPRPEKRFVTSENGEFRLDGKTWRPHGVNYMPSSGIAAEDKAYFEMWLGARSYDPAIIQRDLERCAGLGFNALSIFLYREYMEDQNLLDLLRRMDLLGMKANLSLRPGTPMDFPWDSVREMIEYYRLAENDTVFAYDLAWEPQFRPFERDPFNRDWEAWLMERYGSVENAEKDWGFAVPRDVQGRVANFTENMIGKEGPWSPMVAAYRRFLDTLLYEKYSAARRLVKGVDPNHHVSFRMSMAGDPTDTQVNTMLYDFAYLGGAVDVFEPEGYGRIGDWERVKPGRFTHEYARWSNPALPMIWAEAGVHVWDMALMATPEDKLQFQADYFRDYYRMMLESGADGIFWWWYPGGFRTNENSDYGIINPDGTERPVGRVIREHAPGFVGAQGAKPVDAHLTFDRDAHTNGLTGVYSSLQEEFWGLVAKGKTPGLKTEATGTDSATCPLIAVGNRPCTGQNPPKHLDACFDAVELLDGANAVRTLGRNTEVGPGSTIRVTLTNLGEAALLAGDGTGSVFLTAVSGDARTEAPLPARIERFKTAVVEIKIPEAAVDAVTVRLEAKGRTSFGPRWILICKSKD